MRECYACDDGLRCGPCRPKDWTPPDALAWLAQYSLLVGPEGRIRRNETTPITITTESHDA